MDKQHNIRNIIFDFGGVIYDIDFMRLLAAFNEHGIVDSEHMYAKHKQDDLFVDLEKGSIGPEAFAEKFRGLTNLNLNDEQVFDLWNKILIDFVGERIDAIKDASSNYRLFLMSNTNIIHYNHYSQQYREQFPGELPDLFEKMYLSYEMGMVKPDIRIFEQILQENNLKAEETVFIDDLDANVYAAVKTGIRGLILNSGKDLKDLFENGKMKEDTVVI